MEPQSQESIRRLNEEIRQKYNKLARKYAALEPLEGIILGVRKLRRRLLQKASGKILEIACGSGVNFPYFNSDCEITAVDFSPAMLDIAREEAVKSGLKVDFLIADAASLDFPDHSFDTVVSSLTLCTFPDPIDVLREMARVCRKDGQILLLEHGRSDREWLGRWQEKKAEEHAKALNCHWTREPLELVKEAGLKVVESGRFRLGMLHTIVAKPPTTLDS